MPQPHHRQATKGSTKSHGSNRTCVEMGRLKACRRVARALEHGGNGSATGTSDVGHRQERVMPKPHRRQATGTAGVSVSVSLAHNGLACVEMGRLKACGRVAQALGSTMDRAPQLHPL